MLGPHDSVATTNLGSRWARRSTQSKTSAPPVWTSSTEDTRPTRAASVTA
jgi:hypothetical protein